MLGCVRTLPCVRWRPVLAKPEVAAPARDVRNLLTESKRQLETNSHETQQGAGSRTIWRFEICASTASIQPRDEVNTSLDVS